ncbi:hypothetical protein JK636_08660 [Clostridium sp. YIM B02515]|uniref:YhhN-like protein n=1 Tax=Clostridium rhizosphaerae TaxID=2803861 RepID=A0ABS1T908_9CLOT|nr:hypothetical protein [Clostridium rhizosphaerae]MBL4935829.1 hypothetical protein [Clostridium rhizosphaerae]
MNEIISKKLLIRYITYLIVGIYSVFLYIDLSSKNLENNFTIYLKYFIIVLCFILTLLIGKEGYGKADSILVNAARLFTLIADYYLLIVSDYKLGILCFCFVQIIYIIRHTLKKKNRFMNLMFLIFAVSIGIVLSTTININNIEGQLLRISLIYASLLISSLYCSLTITKSGLYHLCSAVFIEIGMLLFFMCDLNVGLFNILENIQLKFLTGFLIWLFYAPSQLLLSFSGYNTDYLKQVFYHKG